MRCIGFVLFWSITLAQAQSLTYYETLAEYRKTLNAEFADAQTSPLTEADREHFKGLDFYPVDSLFRITARFVRTPDQPPFPMPTTTGRTPLYEKFGEAYFSLKGQACTLSIYQSHRLRKIPEFRDHLFLPFTDLTNGQGSYGGGRFIDLHIPEGDSIVLDFNTAYNPYCAYNSKYSCPIPPAENHLDLAIPAGVKADH